jgi:5-methylcytosine-specific restriction endonuclease McrA
MKLCIHCGKELQLKFFYNDKSKRDGKKPRCKKCEKEYVDMENRRKYEKEYWQRNKNRKVLKAFRYNSKKENKIKAHEKRKLRYYDKDFILRRHINDMKRRFNIKNKIDMFYLKKLIETQKYCYYCGYELFDKYEIEHKIPVSRGGDNSNGNIILSCVKCNRQKGKKTDKEFIEHLSFLKGVDYQVV